MSQRSLPEKFYRGIEQFNRQEFFEAHETLESVWKDRVAADRILVQGIIQVAVGCHHLRNGNIDGALSLFKQALPKIEPFKPSYARLDVESFIQEISRMQRDSCGENSIAGKLASRYDFPLLKPC